MKKILFGVVAICFISILGYFFFWPSDLLITFKAKAIPGVVNQSIKLWANALDNAKLIEEDNLQKLEHQVSFQDSTYRFIWKIKPLNDSVSKVKVLITDQENSWANRLKVPFFHTDFEKRMERTVLDLMETLKDHTDKFRVTIIGEETLPEISCAYLSFQGKQTDKALEMMRNYTLISNALAENDITSKGAPFIEVEQWDMQKDSIQFNFCFPAEKTDTLIGKTSLKFKKTKKIKAVKAIYNGNYITSDRAWYALLQYAENNNIKVAKKPIEFFYSNPNMGGNELDWKAEVYLPIIE